MVKADEDTGLGDMPYPPSYPKMPGEPPRVQPSKKVAANWDEDGNAEKGLADGPARLVATQRRFGVGNRNRASPWSRAVPTQISRPT